MSNSNYWQSFTNSRITRRRALATTGAGALGAAFLAACGGSNESSNAPAQDKSGMIVEPVDTTDQAKAGGTLKSVYLGDILHMDALLSASSSTVNQVSALGYSRLLKYSVGKYPKVGDYGVEGDLAESFEVSADRLQFTFKLRPGLKWDSRAPTNGRAIDAQDVVWSWGKFGSVNPISQNLVYHAQNSPLAPIESISAPDRSTVVMKLRQPDSSALALLAGFDQFYPMPKESDGQFDPKTDVRGSGPWMLDEYRPSAYAHWKKNPDYYLKGRPYFDRLEFPIITEYAQQLAQFKAGNIFTPYTNTGLVQPQDITQTKKDVSQLVLRQAASFLTSSSPYLSFGYEGDSPFKDVRMRQAVSMSLDRDGYTDVIDNRESYAKDGLEVAIASNTVVSPGWGSFWLDPSNEKEFGPSAKYLQFNAAEAKKLMSAAGFANGVDFDFFYNQDNNYAAPYSKLRELYPAMLADVGMRTRQKGNPYAIHLDQWHNGYLSKQFLAGEKKGFNGILLLAERSYATVGTLLFGVAHKDGGAYHGATPDGRNVALGDPKLNDSIDKIRQETDRNRQQALVHDVIRYYTQQAYMVPKPTLAKPFSLWWPSLGNVGVFNSIPSGANIWAEDRINWWLDQTKAPFNKS